MTVHPSHRRPLVAALAVVLATVVAACGSNDDDGAAEGTSSPTASGSELRVVDLSDSLFDLALLDVPVVGNVYGREYVDLALTEMDVDPEVAEALRSSPNVAPNFAVDVEQIISLEPDVILVIDSFTALYGDALDELEAVAEVVSVDDSGSWQERTRAVAEAVGIPASAVDDRIEVVEAGIAATADAVAAADRAGATVSLVRSAGDRGAYVFVPPSLASTVLAEVGLTQPAVELQATADPVFPGYAAQTAVAGENLAQHDADVVLYGTSQPAELETFLAQPLVSSWGATAAGEVHAVPYFLWALNSATGVEQMLEDIDAYVVG